MSCVRLNIKQKFYVLYCLYYVSVIFLPYFIVSRSLVYCSWFFLIHHAIFDQAVKKNLNNNNNNENNDNIILIIVIIIITVVDAVYAMG